MTLARAWTRARLFGLCLALGFTFSHPALAAGSPLTLELQTQLIAQTTGEARSFYAYEKTALWIDPGGSLDPAADQLVKLIETADEDGLDPAAFDAEKLSTAVNWAKSNPTPDNLAKAETLLSNSFAAYVAALRSGTGEGGMQYEASTLRPRNLGVYYTLKEAAKAPSLADYIHDMRWMHPLYAPLRDALMAEQGLTAPQRAVAIANLQRIRQIPPHPDDRYILIDAANATLWMYEGDRPVDSMRVIVGKAATQTPIYAGYVRYAVVNPYWNVPDNLVQSLIARNVLAQGVKYLKRQGYEVVDGWEDGAQVLDPLTIDWAAARRGDIQLHVRQLPSSFNSMGKVKYEFPNVYGIYLHDTPERDLLQKDVRQLSNGCIRLEDAKRLGRWLMDGELPPATATPEVKVDLPKPVPIYITYLTAHVDGGQIALSADPYSHDGVALAQR